MKRKGVEFRVASATTAEDIDLDFYKIQQKAPRSVCPSGAVGHDDRTNCAKVKLAP